MNEKDPYNGGNTRKVTREDLDKILERKQQALDKRLSDIFETSDSKKKDIRSR